MKKLIFFSTLLSLSLSAQEIKQVKGKNFVFMKESSRDYKNGQKSKFYGANKKVALIAKIKKCNSTKCMAVMLKKRKGFKLRVGEMIYSQKSSSSSPSTKAQVHPGKGKHRFAVKGGLGGQNSASIFGEFDYIANRNWVYGFSLSSRLLSRDDLEVSGMGFGGRVDYHFSGFEENGFLASVNLGMVSLTYSVVDITSVSQFEESESVPYFTLMGGYKMSMKKFYLTFAGGLSYIGYKEKFEDPNSTAVFTNPYASMDLALEVSLAYPF